MTPALKAMVEAMGQTESGGTTLWQVLGNALAHDLGPGDIEGFLEKVARAGLLAVRPLDALDQTTLLPIGGFGEMALRSAIDEILKETP